MTYAGQPLPFKTLLLLFNVLHQNPLTFAGEPRIVRGNQKRDNCRSADRPLSEPAEISTRKVGPYYVQLKSGIFPFSSPVSFHHSPVLLTHLYPVFFIIHFRRRSSFATASPKRRRGSISTPLLPDITTDLDQSLALFPPYYTPPPSRPVEQEVWYKALVAQPPSIGTWRSNSSSATKARSKAKRPNDERMRQPRAVKHNKKRRTGSLV